MTINSMIRICMQPMRSWTQTQEGFFFFPLWGEGGVGGGIKNLLCSHHVPMCSYIYPCVSLGFSMMFLRFPMSSPRVLKIASHWLAPSHPHRWAKGEGLHFHIETSIVRSLSSFSLYFLVLGESNWPTANIKLFTVFPL